MGKNRRSKEYKNSSRIIDMDEARKERLEKRRSERLKEEEKARAAAKQKTRGKRAIRRSRNKRRAIIALVIVVVLVLLGATVFKIIALNKERIDVQNQHDELIKEKKELEKQLNNINDPKNLEEQARNQLRLIKPGEMLYMFPEEMTK